MGKIFSPVIAMTTDSCWEVSPRLAIAMEDTYLDPSSKVLMFRGIVIFLATSKRER